MVTTRDGVMTCGMVTSGHYSYIVDVGTEGEDICLGNADLLANWL
jgi:hypothetical protein